MRVTRGVYLYMVHSDDSRTYWKSYKTIASAQQAIADLEAQSEMVEVLEIKHWAIVNNSAVSIVAARD